MGLFVILPDRAAWIATEVVLFSLIAIGMYVFLRALKLSTVGLRAGRRHVRLRGPVLSQVNHVDMTEGFVSIPLMLLAVLHIVRDGRWRWSILLGVAFATVILGGAPEAMLDEALLVIAFAALSAGLEPAALVARADPVWRRRGTGPVALAAIQWLPGLEAIRNSQRAAWRARRGRELSRAVQHLSLVPYLDGGYGHLGEARSSASTTCPRSASTSGFCPSSRSITLWHPRWPSRLAPRDRLTWYVVGLVGLLLALGSNTPLEHLFNCIPLYGHQRLQSRNMITSPWRSACCSPAGSTAPTHRGCDDPMTLVRPDHGARSRSASWLRLAVWALVAHRLAGARRSPAWPLRSEHRRHVREATIIALVFCAGRRGAGVVRPRLPHSRGRGWPRSSSSSTSG